MPLGTHFIHLGSASEYFIYLPMMLSVCFHLRIDTLIRSDSVD